MAKQSSKTKGEVRDELAGVIADALNSHFKEDTGFPAAYFLGEQQDDPASISEWIPTGSTMLDFAISNRKHGGIPVGRITEFTGLEGSSKSLICAHIIANTQKKGGVGVYIDTENAVSREFFAAVGVDIPRMVYVPLETVEDCFETVEKIIEKVRKSDKDRLVTIVIDSIAGASTKIEMAADFDKDGYATQKAIILSKAMRKVTNLIGREKIAVVLTNQLRMNMNAMAFGEKWVTSGGKSIPFHSSVRVRLNLMGKIKQKIQGIDEVVGGKVKAVVIKNRLGPPHREAEYEVYYKSGIDDYSGWISKLKDYGLVKQGGAYYTWVNKVTGEAIKFQKSDFIEKIISVPENLDALYDEMASCLIMEYSHGDTVMSPVDDDSITLDNSED